MSSAQNKFPTLNEAFDSAKKQDKPLLVIRYHQGMIDFPKNYNNETDDSQLEALLKEDENNRYLDNEFIVFRLNSETSDSAESNFQYQFILDYTPNLLLFTSNGELVDFIRPSFYESDNKNLIVSLKDTLNAKEIYLQTRLKLEKKFNKKSITTPELLELLRLRTQVHLKSRDAFNELAMRKGEISDTLMEAILSQEFKTSDPLVDYILHTKSKNINWAFYKTMLIDQILEQARNNKDKVEFENASKLKNPHGLQLIEETSKIHPETPFFEEQPQKEYLSETVLSENLNFYASVLDSVNVVKYGNAYADYILKDYQKKRESFIESQIATSEYMMSQYIANPETDSIRLKSLEFYKTNREEIKKKHGNYFDTENADNLNRIAWAFYESVSDKSELEKALGWAEKSIELKNNAAILDTYAHVLFKSGQKEKAIEYETKALELAKIEMNDKYIQEFQQEINRFKKSAKN